MDRDSKSSKKPQTPRDKARSRTSTSSPALTERSSQRSELSEDRFLLDTPRVSTKTASLTFAGIPLALDSALRYIVASFTPTSKFRRPVARWTAAEIQELLETEGVALPLAACTTALLSAPPETLRHAHGLSLFAAQRVAHVHGQLAVFSAPASPRPLFPFPFQFFDASDDLAAVTLLMRFQRGEPVNLFRESNPFVVLRFFRVFFLSLQRPFFPDDLVERLDDLAASRAPAADLLDAIHRGTEPGEFPVFHRTLECLAQLATSLPPVQATSLYAYFFTCFSPRYTFDAAFLAAAVEMVPPPRATPVMSFDSPDQIDGETIVAIATNVHCPRCVLTDPVTIPDVAIPGRLAVTNYRVIFLSSIKLDTPRATLLGRITKLLSIRTSCPSG